MSKIWNDLKSNMKDWSSAAVEKAEEVSKVAVAKTEELTKISKIKLAIHQLQRDKNKEILSLGKLVYSHSKEANMSNFTGNTEFFSRIEKIDNLNIQILEKEEGIIPMTCYPFEKQNNSRLLFIGTAGGWTKASSGYTFKNIINKTVLLIEFLKKENDLIKFNNKSRFKFYDLVLIDVLFNYNHLGHKIF